MTAPLPFALIFDMDGVLVDSEPLQIRSYVQAWAEFGLELTSQELIEYVVNGGMLLKTLFESRGGRSAEWDALFRRKTEIYRELVRNELKLMPGAMELLGELKADDIPRALATSAARVSMDLVLARFDLAPYFGATVTFEDVTNHKPHPGGRAPGDASRSLYRHRRRAEGNRCR
jgi:beta-phosphoglucomutase-like phosphatase (HAD superfamily)